MINILKDLRIDEQIIFSKGKGGVTNNAYLYIDVSDDENESHGSVKMNQVDSERWNIVERTIQACLYNLRNKNICP